MAEPSRRPGRAAARTLERLAVYGLLVAGSLVMLLPLVWMVSTSLKADGQVMVVPPQWIPDPVRWDNYRRLFQRVPLFRFMLNSLLVAGVTTTGQILLAAMAAYAFARGRFRGRDSLFVLYLATLMLPFQVIITPLFLLVRSLGWVNTYQGLIVPRLFSAFGVFLLRQFFLTIPRSLDEAAFMDGASHWTIFTRIMLPLSKPALATLAIFAFMNSWNDYLWPLVVVSDPKLMTLPLGLAALQGRWTVSWNLVMAGTVVSIVPILAVYLAAQKRFVEGITLTGLKG